MNTTQSLAQKIEQILDFKTKYAYGKTLEDMLVKSVNDKNTCFISFLSGAKQFTLEDNNGRFDKSIIIYVRTDNDMETFCDEFVDNFDGLQFKSDNGAYQINILQYSCNYDLDFELIEINITLERL